MKIFTYGTLIFPEIMNAVTGRSFDSIEAVLEGHARFTVKGKPYPGMQPSEGSRTHGRLYFGVDAESVLALDQFEGSLYERRPVFVMDANHESVTAETYLVPDHNTNLLSSDPWDPEWFLSEWFEPYLQYCRTFRGPGRKKDSGRS